MWTRPERHIYTSAHFSLRNAFMRSSSLGIDAAFYRRNTDCANLFQVVCFSHWQCLQPASSAHSRMTRLCLLSLVKSCDLGLGWLQERCDDHAVAVVRTAGVGVGRHCGGSCPKRVGSRSGVSSVVKANSLLRNLTLTLGQQYGLAVIAVSRYCLACDPERLKLEQHRCRVAPSCADCSGTGEYHRPAISLTRGAVCSMH